VCIFVFRLTVFIILFWLLACKVWEGN
jgi:hypothetical protein